MNHSSFLPEDYLAHKAERRTNVICLSLFGVVMASVFFLFLFTNKQWSKVKAEQDSINLRYEQAAIQIQELSELEEQKDQMLDKAELAAALVERVPRSVLMAELINRMPERLGLLRFELSSEQIKRATRSDSERGETGRLGAQRAPTKEEAESEINQVEPPRYQVELVMVGVAPTDLEVSRYISELNAYDLLHDVTLEYSEEKEINERTMREFRIRMRLDPDADVRHINPLVVPRARNPLGDEVQFSPPGARNTVLVPNRREED